MSTTVRSTHLLVAQLAAQPAVLGALQAARRRARARKVTAVGASKSRDAGTAGRDPVSRNSSSSVPAAVRAIAGEIRYPEGHGYGGFPVSGIWLRCDVPGSTTVTMPRSTARRRADRHHVGAASRHRIIGGSRSLLFGPYAGFSTLFPQARLAHGPVSRRSNSGKILFADAGRRTRRCRAVRIPDRPGAADLGASVCDASTSSSQRQSRHDWKQAVAGQRVQIIKPDQERTGVLEFGTERTPPVLLCWLHPARRQVHPPPHSLRSACCISASLTNLPTTHGCRNLKQIIPT